MFERFTEQARRTLFFARFEVTQLGATAIEPEHILLGLFREPKGLVARIFEQSGVSTAELSVEIADRHEFRERIPTSQEVPFSTETKRVLQYAAEEADRLTHSYIGTEHLLLGVLREERVDGGRAPRPARPSAGRRPARRSSSCCGSAQTACRGRAIAAEQIERIFLIKQLASGARTAGVRRGEARRTASTSIETKLDVLMRGFQR